MFKDVLGNEIKPGDKIIYFTSGYGGGVVKRTATIRYFKVDKYRTKAVVDVIRTLSNGTQKNYCVYITKAIERCVKVAV